MTKPLPPEQKVKIKRDAAWVEKMRQARIASGNLGGRPKNLTKAEAREKALRELEPKAIQVLREVLESENLELREKVNAALKLLEHKWGRPTQRVEADIKHEKIEYVTAAWMPPSEN